MVVKYLDNSIECATALKGDNYVHLLDANGDMIAAFDEVSDFSGFKISGGNWTTPTDNHHCYIAVVRDDGTIAKGGHKCSDIQQRDRVVNLLDNSWFVNPINQRGLTSFAGVGYFIDRWASWAEDNHLNLNANGITVTKSLIQGIACDNTKTYTAAVCLADGSIYVGTGIPENEDFGVWNKVWVTKTEYGVIFYLHAESEQTYRWAALYEGAYDADTLPAYQYKGYAAELAECQRYYFTMPNDPFANGQTLGAGNAALFSIQTPVSMRVNEPTLDLHDGSLTIRCNGADYPVTALSQQGKTGCFVSFMAQAEGLPPKHACASYVVGGGSKVALSADL